MPREVAAFDADPPAIALLFAVGTARTWLLDRVIAHTGLYRVRSRVCGVLGLAVYR